MRCEEILAQLSDYVLGTLPETDRAAVRAHLRGCSTCRAEVARLDEGVALFASATHDVEPPRELEDRVMAVLADEWADPGTPRRSPRFVDRRWLPLAAAAAVLIGALSWGTVAQVRANRNAPDAAAYRTFLETLGGRDLRVAALSPVGHSGVEGSAVLYDSDREQSWALVLVRAPGWDEQLLATLAGPNSHTIELFPIELEGEGEGATWLATSSDISRYHVVRVSTADGTVVAEGDAAHGD